MKATQTGDGRVALVTGGGSGLGRGCAERLAADGFTVVVGDIDSAGAGRTVDAVEGSGGVASAVTMDVSSLGSCRDVVAGVERDYGRLDVLVCSAGIGQQPAAAWEQDEEVWNRIIDVNLTGTWRSCTAAIPLMLKRSSGSIVVISSVAGKEGNPLLGAYSASKAGLLGLVKSLGKELATSGILVNAITPALIDTPIIRNATPEVREQLLSKIPMGRLGQVDEVAALVSWLASNECTFSTASTFDISGGRSTY